MEPSRQGDCRPSVTPAWFVGVAAVVDTRCSRTGSISCPSIRRRRQVQHRTQAADRRGFERQAAAVAERDAVHDGKA